MVRSSALCHLSGRLDGKLAIVTGANSGIGKETTAELACRNKGRAEEARKWILDCYAEGKPQALTKNVANEDIKKCLTPVKPEQLVFEEVDMASFASIKAFAQRILANETRIDFLINNAGIMACPYGETANGLEMQIGTNHFGHFLLTELLMPAIKKAAPGSRIICLSSIAHKKGKVDTTDMNLRGKKYGRWKAYSQSKLANVIHARQLAQRHKDEGIIAVSVHPGVVKTELYKGRFAVFRALSRPFMKNEWEGAQTTVYAVLAPDLENGGYYADCAPASINHQAQDDSICAKVWEMSCKTVGLDSPENQTTTRRFGWWQCHLQSMQLKSGTCFTCKWTKKTLVKTGNRRRQTNGKLKHPIRSQHEAVDINGIRRQSIKSWTIILKTRNMHSSKNQARQ